VIISWSPKGDFFRSIRSTCSKASARPGAANSRITPKTTLSTLDGYIMRWPPLSEGRVGWPKGVPRIAMLDDKTRSSGSRAANSRFSPPSLISIPLMPNKEEPNKSTSPWGVQLVGGLSEVKALAQSTLRPLAVSRSISYSCWRMCSFALAMCRSA
jgi:hypothetical protein